MIDYKLEFEIGKILEHPVILERVEDCVEKLPGNSDNGLARATFGFDTFVKITQVGAVPLGNECALCGRFYCRAW